MAFCGQKTKQGLEGCLLLCIVGIVEREELKII